ncbi:MAG: hypothetical protein Q7S80_02700 [bacterium]|nr:hypothetical protein [bacterium]
MKTWIKVLMTVIVTGGIVGYGAYYFVNKTATADKKNLQTQIDDLNKKITDANTALTAAQATTSTTATTDPTAGWKTYTNSTYGYSFKYPGTVNLTASLENSNNLAISATAAGVNVFPAGESVGNGIFYVSVPNIAFTTVAIKNQFGVTKAENITTTATTLDGASCYIITIQNDSSVVSKFYFVKNTSGTVLELTVVKSSTDAQKILSSFKITK